MSRNMSIGVAFLGGRGSAVALEGFPRYFDDGCGSDGVDLRNPHVMDPVPATVHAPVVPEVETQPARGRAGAALGALAAASP